MTSPSYEARVRAWSATRRWRDEAERLLQAMALPPGAQVLDVGAGAGPLEPLLHERGLTCVGLDRWDAWECAGGAARRVRGDAHRLPLRAASFDAVVLHHVIAHLGDPIEALREARRVLRPDGILGLATPNARFVRALALSSLVRGYRRDPTVVAHLTRGQLVAMARSAGFRVVEVFTWGGTPARLPVAVLRERVMLVARPAA